MLRVSAVDEYFKSLDPEARSVFEHIRALARDVAPEAEGGTSYGMAALKYQQKPLLGFRAAKNHLSVFPFSAEVVDAVRDQLAGFDVSKGTVRFSGDRPPPDSVITEIVRLRIQEIVGPGH